MSSQASKALELTAGINLKLSAAMARFLKYPTQGVKT
jgi:hypothetical protein